MKNEKEREGDQGYHGVYWGPRRFTPCELHHLHTIQSCQLLMKLALD